VRILIFHGYLLDGTGSNVYNARLARALVKLGYEVHLFSQDRHPERQAFVDGAGDWETGELSVRQLRESPQTAGAPACTVYRPNIGDLLPVYVQDRYEGIEAKTFADCSDEQVAAYVQANVLAVREVLELVRPQAALANHLVMGPAILARALQGKVPYAVKVHGSALEYTVKPQPERFMGYAREGLAGARTVLVGSEHTAASLWAALEDPDLEARTRLGPPGVDIEHFRPLPPPQAEAELQRLSRRLRAGAEREREAGAAQEQTSAFSRDADAAARAVEQIAGGSGALVAFVGKLIVSKGMDLLVAAWPLVLQEVHDARLVVVGFGSYRRALEDLVAALSAGDLGKMRSIAEAGRALESDAPAGNAVPLRHLLAFLDSLSAEGRRRYLSAARGLAERIVFTGRLDHEELASVLPACEALVVPSTFPEAFGMVAAEAASCGVLPISAGHSGLAEVSAALARELPSPADRWLSFPVDDQAVEAIAERVRAWLAADEQLKVRVREALVAVVRKRWSWEGVAREVISAAGGEPAAS
jgi:glycosyltransferase involved in cell wall biosynthesis